MKKSFRKVVSRSLHGGEFSLRWGLSDFWGAIFQDLTRPVPYKNQRPSSSMMRFQCKENRKIRLQSKLSNVALWVSAATADGLTVKRSSLGALCAFAWDPLIHPFRDGDGRVGRLLAILMALQAGLPPLDFSEIAGKKRTAYFAAVQEGMSGNYGMMEEIFRGVIDRTLSSHGWLRNQQGPLKFPQFYPKQKGWISFRWRWRRKQRSGVIYGVLRDPLKRDLFLIKVLSA